MYIQVWRHLFGQLQLLLTLSAVNLTKHKTKHSATHVFDNSWGLPEHLKCPILCVVNASSSVFIYRYLICLPNYNYRAAKWKMDLFNDQSNPGSFTVLYIFRKKIANIYTWMNYMTNQLGFSCKMFGVLWCFLNCKAAIRKGNVIFYFFSL